MGLDLFIRPKYQDKNKTARIDSLIISKIAVKNWLKCIEKSNKLAETGSQMLGDGKSFDFLPISARSE